MLFGTAAVYAGDKPAVSIGSVTETSPGKTISVDINIENTAEIYGFNFTVGFDNKYLTPDTVTRGDDFKKFTFMANTSETDINKPYLTQVTIVGDTTDPVAANGKLCTITFEVKNAAKTGVTALNIDEFIMVDENLEDIDADIVNGTVKIVNGAQIGDMDLDGQVTDEDAKELLKAVTEIVDPQTLVEHGNADEGDDVFNILDVINILRQK